MKENRIICISREFGSGDHELGEHLSEKLGIKLFDSEIITKVAELCNVPEDFVEEQGEVRDFRGFLGVMPSGHAAADITRDFVVTSEKLFALQSIAIRQMAKDEGSCIFVGRCADVILQNQAECISVFVHSPLEDRIQRIMDLRQITEKEARKLIKRTDRERASYHNYYTKIKWGHPSNYHLVLNMGKLGMENAVDLISYYVER